MPTAVRWKIDVSKTTDVSVRAFLRSRGVKEDGLSKFVEEVVRWRVFQCAIQDIKARNSKRDPVEMQALIEKSVSETRASRGN